VACCFVYVRGAAWSIDGASADLPDVLQLLGWIVLRARSDRRKEIDILVSATSLFVLRRGTPRPRTIWSAALIAALTRLPPGSRRLGLLDHSQSR
jgi:hypothetical protein